MRSPSARERLAQAAGLLGLPTVTASIERERTALHRTALSSPIQHLLRFGFLDERNSLFDYGCGRGDDVRLLAEMGIAAEGWDPVFRPETERTHADVVNLGFVLNVIEDAREREETLKRAFALARKVLIVSVMLGYEGKREQSPPTRTACAPSATRSRSTTPRTSSAAISNRP